MDNAPNDEDEFERIGNAALTFTIAGGLFSIAGASIGFLLLNWTHAPLIAITAVSGVIGGYLCAQSKALRSLSSYFVSNTSFWGDDIF